MVRSAAIVVVQYVIIMWEEETVLTEFIGKLCNAIIVNKLDEPSLDSERLPSKGVQNPRH